MIVLYKLTETTLPPSGDHQTQRSALFDQDKDMEHIRPHPKSWTSDQTARQPTDMRLCKFLKTHSLLLFSV